MSSYKQMGDFSKESILSRLEEWASPCCQNAIQEENFESIANEIAEEYLRISREAKK